MSKLSGRATVQYSYGSIIGLVLVGAGICVGPVLHIRAQDQDTDPAVTATARALAVEGVKLAQADACPAAIDKLEHAEKLRHSAIVLTRLGECYIKVGRLLSGVESLRAVLREPLPANPSPALQQAYTDAQAATTVTQPLLAHLTIVVEGADDMADLKLSIDGRALPPGLLGVTQPCDPGDHTIRVAGDGYLPDTRHVALKSGEDQRVIVSLARTPKAELRASAPASAARAEHTQTARQDVAGAVQRPSASANHAPAYIIWGVSAAALGVGVGFGLSALNNKTELDKRCPAHACGDNSRALLEQTRDRALISTIGYAAAGGGAALGLLLFLLEQPDETAQPRAAAATGARVRILADAQSTGVRIDF
ncbi:MAG: hypothetical protein RL701_2974 [Pseudomonadota bacterium]|jgi:hypothetical protein